MDFGIDPKTNKQLPNAKLIKDNKEMNKLIIEYITFMMNKISKNLGTPQETNEKEELLCMLTIYSIHRRIYQHEDRDLWKSIWSLQKKSPILKGFQSVLCYVSKFMMELVPLSRKSLTMEPKDPMAFIVDYYKKNNTGMAQQVG